MFSQLFVVQSLHLVRIALHVCFVYNRIRRAGSATCPSLFVVPYPTESGLICGFAHLCGLGPVVQSFGHICEFQTDGFSLACTSWLSIAQDKFEWIQVLQNVF